MLCGMKKRKAKEPDRLLVELQPKVRGWLEQIKRRDGVSYKAQVERALVLWAQSKGLEASL